MRAWGKTISLGVRREADKGGTGEGDDGERLWWDYIWNPNIPIHLSLDKASVWVWEWVSVAARSLHVDINLTFSPLKGNYMSEWLTGCRLASACPLCLLTTKGCSFLTVWYNMHHLQMEMPSRHVIATLWHDVFKQWVSLYYQCVMCKANTPDLNTCPTHVQHCIAVVAQLSLKRSLTFSFTSTC